MLYGDELMKYIVHRDFSLDNINLPKNTVCECDGSIVVYNGKIICGAKSERAHQFLSVDDDGNGILRGQLTQRIQKILSTKDDNYHSRWDRVWEDSVCQKYRREDHPEHWLWNHDFFSAEISDLEYIISLIDTKEG